MVFDFLRSLQSVSVTHTAGITTNAAAIMKKADDAILFEVDDLSKKLTKIEEFQIKEQNYGLNVRLSSRNVYYHSAHILIIYFLLFSFNSSKY